MFFWSQDGSCLYSLPAAKMRRQCPRLCQAMNFSPLSGWSPLMPRNPSDVQIASITDTTIIPHPPDSINTPTLNLKANSVYNVQVLFLDETKTPPGNVTDDIYDRRNYHLICFIVSGGTNLTVVRTD